MVTRAAPSVSLETVNLSRKATMGRKEEREMKFFLLSVSPLVNPYRAFLFIEEETTSNLGTENREK